MDDKETNPAMESGQFTRRSPTTKGGYLFPIYMRGFWRVTPDGKSEWVSAEEVFGLPKIK